jgi:hypothetical protein
VPFVRFARDKRGYEYVYLVHDSTRGSQSSRPVVLYWYRTPPGVRVGRQPFDEEVRQRLEAQNPEIRFDWRAITSAQPPPPDAEHWRERRRAEKAAKLARVKDERDETRDDVDAVPKTAAADDGSEEIAETEEFHNHDPAVVSALELGAVEERAPAGEGESAIEGAAAPATAAAQARSRRRRRGRRRKHRPGGPEGTPGASQAASDGPSEASATADQADPADAGESGSEEPGDS